MTRSMELVSSSALHAYIWLSGVVKLDGREESKAALECLWSALEAAKDKQQRKAAKRMGERAQGVGRG
jgi:hypothetical protein